MFEYKSCIVKSNRMWYEVDIRHRSMASLYTTYAEVVITVTNQFLDGPKQFYIADVREHAQQYSGTIIQYLKSIGNQALPLQDGMLDLHNRTEVQYTTIGNAGFGTSFTNRKYHPEMELKRSACTDILIKKAGVDYEELAKRCVFTIGGYIQQPIVREDGVLIPDGLNLMDTLEKDSFGMFNLGVLGDLVYMPITEKNIKISKPIVETFANSVFIENLDYNFMHYDMFLVFAGILHPIRFTRVTGNHILKLNFEDYPFVRRYLDTSDAFKYTALKEVISEDDYEVVAKLCSNDGIYEWLKDNSAFLIGVTKVPNRPLCVETKLLIHSGIRGSLLVQEPPVGIMVNSAGKIMDYTTIPHDNGYEVVTKEDFVPNWLANDNVQWNQTKVIQFTKDRMKPYTYSNGLETIYYYLT